MYLTSPERLSIRTLKGKPIHPIPPGALMLKGAQGDAIHVHGYIYFDVTLGTATASIDALVISYPGKDELIIDNRAMRSLHAVLDWDSETLTLEDKRATTAAKHRRHQAVHREACWLHTGHPNSSCSKCKQTVYAGALSTHFPTTWGYSTNRAPQVTADIMPDLHPAWEHLIVGGALCTWLRDDSSATAQVANTEDHGIIFLRGTALGHITRVASIDSAQLSRIMTVQEGMNSPGLNLGGHSRALSVSQPSLNSNSRKSRISVPGIDPCPRPLPRDLADAPRRKRRCP